MMMIEFGIKILGFYFLVGLLFGIYFGLLGAKRLDAKIGESKWTVNLLLVPGAIILWPILLLKLLTKKTNK